MMDATKPKRLLTRKDITEWLRDFSQPADSTMQERGFNTILAMAELLERVLPFLQSSSVSLYYDIDILLSTFNATGGEGS